MNDVERILCADWGKDEKKRAVYEAIVGERRVRRIGNDARSVSALLRYAAACGARTVVAFDAPLGVPESFLEAVRRRSAGSAATGFLEWLHVASLGHCTGAHDWSVAAPFFHVPAGRGALERFEVAAKARGVELRRAIEQQTGGKSVFITAGVPGSVGSAARDIWLGLLAARKAGLPFRLWPFEGSWEDLLCGDAPVVAEMYPRAAYSTALVDAAPRARMSLSKTDGRERARAVDQLLATRWVASIGVRFENTDAARANEDDFDALMSAAALLRCQLEGLALWAAPLRAPRVEGGILGTGSIDLTLPERAFRRPDSAVRHPRISGNRARSRAENMRDPT